MGTRKDMHGVHGGTGAVSCGAEKSLAMRAARNLQRAQECSLGRVRELACRGRSVVEGGDEPHNKRQRKQLKVT